ncbi:2743_t:CDS:2, partial [Racocetra persica]
HLSSDQNRRLQKKVTETAQERESHLARDRERKRCKARTNANLQQESEQPVISVNIESIYTISENISTLSQIENIDNTSENEEIIIAIFSELGSHVDIFIHQTRTKRDENRIINTVNYQTLNKNQQKSEVDAVNLNKLESLKNPVVKVLAKHTSDQEAKKADSDIAKEAGLVNGSIGTIYDILYNKNGLYFLPVAVFIAFNNYNGPAIRTLE